MSLWNRLAVLLPSRRRNGVNPLRNRSHRRLHLEPLEQRRMLATYEFQYDAQAVFQNFSTRANWKTAQGDMPRPDMTGGAVFDNTDVLEIDAIATPLIKFDRDVVGAGTLRVVHSVALFAQADVDRNAEFAKVEIVGSDALSQVSLMLGDRGSNVRIDTASVLLDKGKMVVNGAGRLLARMEIDVSQGELSVLDGGFVEARDLYVGMTGEGLLSIDSEVNGSVRVTHQAEIGVGGTGKVLMTNNAALSVQKANPDAPDATLIVANTSPGSLVI